MSLGLVTGLLSTLVGAGSGLLANKSHRDFADYLNDQKFTMPTAMDSAESEFRNIASKGLPGKETIEDDIQSQVARSIGLGKQVADSPSALLDLLSKSNEMATSNLRQLGIQDASAQLGNRMQLAEFLSRAKAPMEAMIDDKNINLGISAERERMMGTQELIQGITGGLGGLAQGVSSHMLDKYLTDKNDILKGFYDFSNSNSSDSKGNNNVVDVARDPNFNTKSVNSNPFSGYISNQVIDDLINKNTSNETISRWWNKQKGMVSNSKDGYDLYGQDLNYPFAGMNKLPAGANVLNFVQNWGMSKRDSYPNDEDKRYASIFK